MTTNHTVDVVASGALATLLPPGERPGRARIEMAPGSSVADLLERLGVAPDRALLVILDGAVIVPADRAGRPLRDGSTLALAPPIRAG